MGRKISVMIAALVFDFDGLILDTEMALIEAYGDVHAHHGIPFDHHHHFRSVGHADYAFDPWSAFGPAADRAALDAHRRQLNIERNRRLEALPGVAPLIASARTAGLRLGVASNSGHWHVDAHLARLGLLDSFDFVACREDVVAPKPEPEIYRLVAAKLGVAGHQTVAFEDSLTGLTAARRAGLRTVAVPNRATAHHALDEADWQVPSLAEVTLDGLAARFFPAAMGDGSR
jgi:HAD superfamily hydrolase (TIGR01509 family)